jgi:hypothetical protein
VNASENDCEDECGGEDEDVDDEEERIKKRMKN